MSDSGKGENVEKVKEVSPEVSAFVAEVVDMYWHMQKAWDKFPTSIDPVELTFPQFDYRDEPDHWAAALQLCVDKPLVREASYQRQAREFLYDDRSRHQMAAEYEKMLDYWRLCDKDNPAFEDLSHLLDISGRPPRTTVEALEKDNYRKVATRHGMNADELEAQHKARTRLEEELAEVEKELDTVTREMARLRARNAVVS